MKGASSACRSVLQCGEGEWAGGALPKASAPVRRSSTSTRSSSLGFCPTPRSPRSRRQHRFQTPSSHCTMASTSTSRFRTLGCGSRRNTSRLRCRCNRRHTAIQRLSLGSPP